METVMNLNNSFDIYNRYDYDKEYPETLNNRLFCTFTLEKDIDDLIISLKSRYSIIYNKLFILLIKDSPEFVITYNIETGNISDIPDNTILVHRKKEFNVLYSINALNELIMSLNEGRMDSSFKINWEDYKNSILLTQQGEFKQLHTKIHKIIEL